jgi:uncharacterized protein
MDDNFFDKLREKIQPYYRDGDGHGFDHTERVYTNALKISVGEKVDMDVVRASALLHDVARSLEEGSDICHAEEGAKMAEEILREMRFPEEKIGGVVHAIKVHRASKGFKAETREAEILQDADRLDALGATILVRMLQASVTWKVPVYDPKIPIKEKYDGSKSSVINHIHEKILKITPESFKTSKAREIAKKRYQVVRDFEEQFMKEWRGEA